jgi:hypothetical protein
MTTPDNGESTPEVDHSRSDPAGAAPFDPYRFGKPDRPVPPEYAPPGYVAPTPEVSAVSPYGPSSPYGAAPPSYGPSGQQPYGVPPGQQPYASPPPYPGQYPPPYAGGYGAPAPPGYHGYVQPRPGNGKAIAALVLGICSIVFFWLSVFDGILIILALVFGIIALSDSKSRGGSGRGMAIAGLICMGVGTVAAIIWTVVLVHAANQCGGFSNNSSQFSQCLQDHL